MRNTCTNGYKAFILQVVLVLSSLFCFNHYNLLAQEQIILQYQGGSQPAEITVLDALDPSDVEFGVPRSRLFDSNSPLNGSDADSLEFPGLDDSTETGILLKTGNWSDSSSKFVTLCIKVTITQTIQTEEYIIVHLRRAGGFKYSEEAQEVIDAGGRNNWARQIRKLIKSETERNPRNANRIDRLRTKIEKKADKDEGYKALLDGTHYMPDTWEWIAQTRFTRTQQTVEIVVYITFSDLNNFESHGIFIPELTLSLTSDPGPDQANMGSAEDNALVVDFVDVAVGVSVPVISFDGNQLTGIPTGQINPDLGVIFANLSQMDFLNVLIFGFPTTVLPPLKESEWEASYLYLPPEEVLNVTIFSSGGIETDFNLVTGPLTSVIDRNLEANIPNDITLYYNYPNPFNPSTAIRFSIPEETFVTLKVFNTLGEEITTLINENIISGNYEVEFDAIGLPSGIYFYRLQVGGFVDTKKMILLK
jgi:hypothetical protein